MSTMKNNVYHQKIGLRPGSIIYTGKFTGQSTTFSLSSYNSEELNESAIDPNSFEIVDNENLVRWHSFKGLNDISAFSKVCGKFEIPVLMQEDILHTRQRSKFDLMGKNSLTVISVPRHENNELIWQQISLFYNEKDIVTFSEKDTPSFDLVLERIRKKSGKIRDLKSDYLLYALIDSVVDQYLNITSYLINEVDDLEIDLLSTKGKIPKNFVQNLYSRKKDLLILLKRVNQIAELVSNLKQYYDSDNNDLDSAYLIDLEDHVSRSKDNLNHLRQLMTEIMNQYLAMNSDHMNEIMKTLTIFSAIFIPLGFIAGVYGMNFNGEHSAFNMPELNWKYGYPTVIGLMVSFVLGLLFVFRKRNWL